MHKLEAISGECDNLMMAPCHKAIQSFNGQAFGLSTRDRFSPLMGRSVASVIANKGDRYD